MAISIHPLSGTRVTEDSSTDPKPADTTPVDAAAVEAGAEGNSNEAGEGPVGYKPGEHRASGARKLLLWWPRKMAVRTWPCWTCLNRRRSLITLSSRLGPVADSSML